MPRRKEISRHSAGYLIEHCPGHPRAFASRGGQIKPKDRVYQHILIAERALGRYLKKGECVHHINGIPDDNRNCNLLISTNGYHRSLHHRAGSAYGRICVLPINRTGGLNDQKKNKGKRYSASMEVKKR